MKFGNSEHLALVVDPVVPSWERRSSDDRGPWARLQIHVRNRNLTQHLPPGSDTVSDGIYVPLAPLCRWLIHAAVPITYEESARTFATGARLHQALRDWSQAPQPPGANEDAWDDARYDWWGRHFLQAADSGAWLPDIGLVRVEDRLWISWADPRFASPEAPRFLMAGGVESVAWDRALPVLTDFTEHVSRSLVEEGDPAFQWAEGPASFKKALEGAGDEETLAAFGWNADALTGLLDAPDLETLRERLVLSPRDSLLASCAIQSLRDLNAVDASVGAALSGLDEVARTAPADNAFIRLRELARRAAASASSPEAAGSEAGKAVRAELGTVSDPLPGDGQLASWARSRMGAIIHEAAFSSRSDTAIAGFRDGGSAVVILADERLTSRRPWMERMDLARTLGHLLLDTGVVAGAVGAGSSNRTRGPRRRRSGAFAAELLLPRSALMERTRGELDVGAQADVFERLMQDFGVGARTAAQQLWNVRLLSGDRVRDELIDAYAAPEVRAPA